MAAQAVPGRGGHLSPSLLHRRLAAEMVPRLAFAGADVEAWRQQARTKITELIGLPQLTRAQGSRTSPAIRTHWRRSDRLGTIEKLSFESGHRSRSRVIAISPSARCDTGSPPCVSSSAASACGGSLINHTSRPRAVTTRPCTR